MNGYILRSYEALEEENFERKYNIVELFPTIMYLSLHPIVLEETISAIPQAFLDLSELDFVWRIEVVEAQVERLSFSISTRC